MTTLLFIRASFAETFITLVLQLKPQSIFNPVLCHYC